MLDALRLRGQGRPSSGRAGRDE